MKIALDALLLFEEQKTGVGWNAARLIETLLNDGGYEYELFYFYNRHLWEHDKAYEERVLRPYGEKCCRIIRCGLFKTLIYRLTKRWLRIPFRYFIPTDADVLQFFNFTVPQGIEAKTVTIVHDMAYKAYPEVVTERNRAWLERELPRSCQDCSVVATVSEFSKSEIIKYLGIEKDKIEVIYCGVDTEIYRPQADRTKIQDVLDKYQIQEEYLLYVGTLEPRKNITKIIEAYAEFRDRSGNPAVLVLAGKKGWMYDEIFRTIQASGLEKNVIVTGYLEDSEKKELIQGAAAFVFPSIYEGFGIPPVEAMACGIPVIAGNAASLPEVVGEGGIMVDPSSPEEIAEAMIYLMENREAREEMGRKALKQAQNFTWAKDAERVRRIYKKLSEI